MRNLLLVLFSGLLVLYGCVDTTASGTGQDFVIRNLTFGVGVGDMPALGQTSAPVTWIEVSDYQCPYCGLLYTQTGKKIKSDYVDSGKVKMHFRDFPMNFHDKAYAAAMAARCASEQGKFWDMHDKLFENQESWENSYDFASVLEGYSDELGMDTESFKACVGGAEYASEISADIADAKAMGIGGTPGVVLVLPKEKTDLAKLKAAFVPAYRQYMELYQDEDEYVVKVVGALPYSAFKQVLDSVDYS